MPTTSIVDPAAAGRGALVAAAIVLPAGAAGVATDGPGWLDALLFALVVLGFAAGGYAAARTSTAVPLTTAAAGTLVLVVTIEVIGAVRRTAADEDLATPAQIAFLALIALTAALAGAGVAAARSR